MSSSGFAERAGAACRGLTAVTIATGAGEVAAAAFAEGAGAAESVDAASVGAEAAGTSTNSAGAGATSADAAGTGGTGTDDADAAADPRTELRPARPTQAKIAKTPAAAPTHKKKRTLSGGAPERRDVESHAAGAELICPAIAAPAET